MAGEMERQGLEQGQMDRPERVGTMNWFDVVRDLIVALDNQDDDGVYQALEKLEFIQGLPLNRWEEDKFAKLAEIMEDI